MIFPWNVSCRFPNYISASLQRWSLPFWCDWVTFCIADVVEMTKRLIYQLYGPDEYICQHFCAAALGKLCWQQSLQEIAVICDLLLRLVDSSVSMSLKATMAHACKYWYTKRNIILEVNVANYHFVNRKLLYSRKKIHMNSNILWLRIKIIQTATHHVIFAHMAVSLLSSIFLVLMVL